MPQLADRVRHVERLRSEKARTQKYHKKKVAYVESNESDQEFNRSIGDVKKGEMNIVELKPGPPYT